MCSKKSVISACSTAPLTSLPSTHQAKTLVSSICDKMYHDVCSDCVEANGPKTYKNEICKPLEVYGSLCHSMPRMPDCDQFHLLCADAPKLPLCQGLPSHPPTGRAGTPPPSMIMYFHSGFREYFLFDYLVPSSHGEYIGYCFAVFLMAVLYEFLVTFGQKWARTDQSRVSVPGSSINPPDHPNDSSSSSAPLLVQDRALETFQQSYIYLNIQRAIIRGTIRFITASVSYLLMLLSMTFNIGIFLSIMLGLGVGSGLTTFYYPTVLNSAECC